MLNHVSMTDVPTVVMGDFNDLLHKPESRIANLVGSYDYTQLVQCPTNAKGTLIITKLATV